jgi:transposase InsO family protein
MMFRFIEDHRQEHPVRLMCRVLGVSPSGYDAWRGRPESPRTLANRRLLADVRRLHAQHRGRYGSPRIHRALPDPSERCRQSRPGCPARRGRHRQPRPDRAPDAAARPSRRRCSPFCPVTTDSRHGLPVAPDLLGQDFDASRPNQVWLSDIAYIATEEGWLYLAAVLDLATRKVVGPRRSADRRPS